MCPILNSASVRMPFIPFIRSHLTRQILAVDLGSSHIKLFFAEKFLGRTNVVQQKIIDLQAEGLLSADEVNRHLRELVAQWGDPPLALVLPQLVTLSQVIDLPWVKEGEIQTVVENQTVNLVGLGGGSVVYDYVRLRPFGKYANPFWITISREQEILRQIERFNPEEQEGFICEVSNAASALISSYMALVSSDPGRVVLVDFGATTTVVVILIDGQCAFATTLPIGSESFTNTIATLKHIPFEDAEAIKRSQNLFWGPGFLPALASVVEIWRKDLEKTVQDWADENPELKSRGQTFRFVMCGGGSEQPGLLSFLKQSSRFGFEQWPKSGLDDSRIPIERFAACHGIVRRIFAPKAQVPSLLPKSLAAAKKQQQQLMLANWVALGLLSLIFLVTLVSSMYKFTVSRSKKNLVKEARLVLAQTLEIEELYKRREHEYQKVVPLLQRQKEVADSLKAIQIMQSLRRSNDVWLVLLADQERYFATNNPTAIPAAPGTFGPDSSGSSNALGQAGFVAEMMIADKRGDKLQVLHDLRALLEKEPLFQNVDTVPENKRSTNFFDPKQLPLDRYHSLHLELSPPDFPHHSTVKSNHVEAPSP